MEDTNPHTFDFQIKIKHITFYSLTFFSFHGPGTIFKIRDNLLCQQLRHNSISLQLTWNNTASYSAIVDLFFKNLTRVMRKPAFWTCENKCADQLHGNPTADQHFVFSLHRSYNSSTFKIRNFKPLTSFFGCTARFVSDLLWNPEEKFSNDKIQIKYSVLISEWLLSSPFSFSISATEEWWSSPLRVTSHLKSYNFYLPFLFFNIFS